MAVFLADSFTATDATALTAHNPDTGGAGSWASVAGYSAPAVYGNRLTAGDTGGSSHVATNTTAPGTADYSVEAVFRAATDTGYAAVGARCDADGNGYWLRRSGGYWMVIARVGGSDTWFGGTTAAITTGTDYTVRLEVEGSTVRFYLGGVLQDTRTDTSITAAGRVGVWLNTSDATTGWSLDTLSCATIGAGGSAPATPTGLTASDGTYADQVVVGWNASANATSYDLTVSTDGGTVYNPLSTGQAGTTYTHTGLATGVTYFYKVRANNGFGSSAYSAAEQGSTAGGGTAVTVGALTTQAMPTSIACDLAFTGGAAGATTCAVAWSADAGATWNTWLAADRIDDLSGTKRFRVALFDLDPATSYQVRLTVADPGGVGGTNPVTASVTTPGLRHAFAAPATVLAGTITHYVRPDGSDANTGTANTAGGAWATVGKALASAPSGAVVQVLASATRSYTVNDAWRSTPLTLIASNPAVDDTGAVTAGDHAVVEFGSGTNNPVVGGPAGAATTYPQVTNTPWVSDGTITDATGVVRTVYYWATGYRPKQIGYAASRFGQLAAVSPTAWNDAAYTPAQWKSWLAGNPKFHSGWMYDATSGRVYLVMPSAAQNPNALYLTLSGGNGITVNGSDVRVCGFVFRGFAAAVHTYTAAARPLVDNCWFDQCGYGVYVEGNKDALPPAYGSQPIVAYCRATTLNLWSTGQAAGGGTDRTCIAWDFVKGPADGGGISVYKPAQDMEGCFVFHRGGAKGVSLHHNVVDGTFNGTTAYNAGFDLWASFGLESHHNTFRHIPDDAIEPEQNASCWVSCRDRIEESAVGVSTGGVEYGPTYVVRDEFWRIGAAGLGRMDDGTCTMGSCVWKYGSTSVPVGRVYWLHCTAWTDQTDHGDQGAIGVDGWQHNAGGGDPYLTAYNNLIRTTRDAANLPNAAQVVEDGNHFATAWVNTGVGSPKGLGFGGVTYQADVAGYRAAYAAATGRTNPKTNVYGDFLDEAIVDTALLDPTAGNLTLASRFGDAGALVPGWSAVYPGSGTIRAWHYAGSAPAAGASETGFAAGGAPAAPTGLAAAALNSSSIRLTWTDVATTEAAYYVERSPNGTTGWAQIGTAAANATSYTDTGLAASTAYYYRVRAGNASGFSAYAAAANATTAALAPPVITNARVENVAGRSLDVAWDTAGVPSTSWVEYATAAEWAGAPNVYPHATAEDPTPVTSHRVTLTGLTPGTTYHVRAASAGSA